MRFLARGAPGANGQVFVPILLAWMTLRLNRSDRDWENPCLGLEREPRTTPATGWQSSGLITLPG
jgi:hypothetical protein